MLDYEDEFRAFLAAEATCNACGWRGTGHELTAGDSSLKAGVGKFHCPQCHHYVAAAHFPQPQRSLGRSMRARISEPFAEGTTFHVVDGVPYELLVEWDWAVRWDTDPPQTVDCLVPLGAPAIGEDEFRALVRQIHGLDLPSIGRDREKV